MNERQNQFSFARAAPSRSRRAKSILSVLLLANLELLSAMYSLRAEEPIGAAALLAFERLPFFKNNAQAHYFGSISKNGENEDWNWLQYKDEDKNEYVLADIDGPGCIYNFLTYEILANKNCLFRFYLDGGELTQQSVTIKDCEFGKIEPFVPPFSDYGCINMHYSMIPLPFRKSCKITSSVPLVFPSNQQGGFGGVVFHTYRTSSNVPTYTTKEDYGKITQILNRAGQDPKSAVGNQTLNGQATINAGQTAAICDLKGANSIASLKFTMPLEDDGTGTGDKITGADNPAWIKQRQLSRHNTTWLQIRWDNQDSCAVNAPFGAFFGSELRSTRTKLLLSHGMIAADSMTYYCYFPMPFWESADISVVNKGLQNVSLKYEVQYKPSTVMNYPRGECGYFHADYKPPTLSVKGKDFVIGTARGHGHFVGGYVAWLTFPSSEEGNVRVYIDGNRTPQVSSDGSESWPTGTGWGFRKSLSNPFTAIDGNGEGKTPMPWAMTKLNLGDWYPFSSQLTFQIQNGGHNEWNAVRSGLMYYYSDDEPAIVLTDELDVGNAASEKVHQYIIVGETWNGTLRSYYEGAEDGSYNNKEYEISDDGRAFNKYSQFTVSINPDNKGVRLRRRCDQSNGGQRAKVFIDDKLVADREWYWSDSNTIMRWLDTDFEIPPSYTAGKNKINIRIVYVNARALPEWNEYHYWIFSYK
jgi:hypothetical protein